MSTVANIIAVAFLEDAMKGLELWVEVRTRSLVFSSQGV